MSLTRLFGLVVLVLAAAGIVGMTAPPTVVAQGCAMCYQSAAASGPRSIMALRHGIIFMMIPSLLVTAIVVRLTWKRRNLHDQVS
jgi:hypothetical protein